MNTIARTFMAGQIAGDPARKQVNGKDLCEFYLADIGLRIVAWDALAAAVPTDGTAVFVEGKVRTRHYQVEGKDRSTTEVIASAIEVIAASADDDEPAF